MAKKKKATAAPRKKAVAKKTSARGSKKKGKAAKGKVTKGTTVKGKAVKGKASRGMPAPKVKKKKAARKRELIDTGHDKRYVRRDEQGEFEHVVDQGLSLADDRRKKSKKTVKAGQGDHGDQAPRKKRG